MLHRGIGTVVVVAAYIVHGIMSQITVNTDKLHARIAEPPEVFQLFFIIHRTDVDDEPGVFLFALPIPEIFLAEGIVFQNQLGFLILIIPLNSLNDPGQRSVQRSFYVKDQIDLSAVVRTLLPALRIGHIRALSFNTVNDSLSDHRFHGFAHGN